MLDLLIDENLLVLISLQILQYQQFTYRYHALNLNTERILIDSDKNWMQNRNKTISECASEFNAINIFQWKNIFRIYLTGKYTILFSLYLRLIWFNISEFL